MYVLVVPSFLNKQSYENVNVLSSYNPNYGQGGDHNPQVTSTEDKNKPFLSSGTHLIADGSSNMTQDAIDDQADYAAKSSLAQLASQVRIVLPFY